MLLALLATAVAAQTSSCGGTFTILDSSLTPAKPIGGSPVTLHLEYSVPTLVTGGTSEIAVTYNFIKLKPTIEPLCQSVPCPLTPGTYKNDTVSTWPTGLSGRLVTVISWYDQLRTLLLCLKIST